MNVRGSCAPGRQYRGRRGDHGRRTGDIDLPAIEVVEVRCHRVVDEAATPVAACFLQHGQETQIGVSFGQFGEEAGHIEVAFSADP